MNFIEKKTCLNTIRFFTNEKPPLKKYENEKFKTSYLLPVNPERKGSGGLRLKNLFKKSLKNKPLISVVTPNLKSDTLEDAILSVLNQEYENIEHIVVDGDSGQKTLELIKKYEDHIDYWVSEKDHGLWDGWNKGLMLATGDYVGILDSTTTFDKDAINILKKYIDQNPDADFFFGSIRKDNKVYAGFRPKDINLRFNIYPSCVISFFIKLESLKKLGLYNTKYKMSADYDLIYRMIVKYNMKGVTTKGNEIFGSFGEVGVSKNYNFFQRMWAEMRIRYDNNQNPLIILFIFFGRCYKELFKTFRIFYYHFFK